MILVALGVVSIFLLLFAFYSLGYSRAIFVGQRELDRQCCIWAKQREFLMDCNKTMTPKSMPIEKEEWK